MNDNLPDIFRQMTPRPAPIELRERVVARVDHELVQRVWSRWERVFELSAVAALLVGVALNAWCWQTDENWQSRVYGPAPIPSGIHELAQIVGSVTDPATGQRLQERLVRQWRDNPRPNLVGREQYQQLLHDLISEKVPSA